MTFIYGAVIKSVAFIRSLGVNITINDSKLCQEHILLAVVAKFDDYFLFAYFTTTCRYYNFYPVLGFKHLLLE
jgi:hypothetical protein